MSKAVVIIPTTGAPTLRRAVESVLAQTVPAVPYVVCDGMQLYHATAEVLAGLDVPLCVLPRNVGAQGFYGHRVYAAFAHLVDEEYVLFLDHDNFFAPEHVAECLDVITARKLDWSYSLRTVCDTAGEFLMRDDCESLGRWPAFTGMHLIDTNAYCVRREVLVQAAHVWHGGWGQDRVFAHHMMMHFPRFDCTRGYTVQYCLGGNPDSVTAEFFAGGNEIMRQHYPNGFPWAR